MKKLIYSVLAMLVIFSSCDEDDNGPTSSALSLNFTGLANLGSTHVYEGWIIVEGAAISTGTFEVDDDGTMSVSSFDVNTVSLEAASKFVLSIEPAGETGADALAPSAWKLLAGDFSGTSASLSTATEPALGDFSGATGSFFLRTPTDETADNNGNDQYGIWFGMPTAPPTSGFTLPTLSSDWIYEGWVVGDAGPISTGTFSSFEDVDSSNGFSGTANNAGPPIPGEDFFNNAPSGETFPLDIRGRTIVISVEPVPDNSSAPFLLKPLVATLSATAETAPTVHTMALSSLPGGSATR